MIFVNGDTHSGHNLQKPNSKLFPKAKPFRTPTMSSLPVTLALSGMEAGKISTGQVDGIEILVDCKRELEKENVAIKAIGVRDVGVDSKQRVSSLGGDGLSRGAECIGCVETT